MSDVREERGRRAQLKDCQKIAELLKTGFPALYKAHTQRSKVRQKIEKP